MVFSRNFICDDDDTYEARRPGADSNGKKGIIERSELDASWWREFGTFLLIFFQHIEKGYVSKQNIFFIGSCKRLGVESDFEILPDNNVYVSDNLIRIALRQKIGIISPWTESNTLSRDDRPF